MKNIFLIALAIVTLVSCNESLKTGFIDNSEVVNNYQEKIDIEAKFKTKVEAFQKRTDSIGRAFQMEAQAFQAKAEKMSDADAQKEYQVLGQKQQMLQQGIQAEEQQIQQQSQAEIDSLLNKVKKYVKEYGEKNGYTYIFGSNDAGSVMYGAEANDLTKNVLEALNADYKKD
ncbi:OmpH family outer membrane protein [Xanthomarina sp. F2636L]|uniref:OmpH family outer membrane protein n=1 Tax=Xanthomarina sp. F2636L TaxID=2996018 RepID=UPI00225E35DA|nr:OmpH family outer membrane protein [Xanthomarina sp. F2636L]MCX7551307.1 OmpH family outer membrane protein [Xanthomarina sp. F2636L]